jgi:tRNA U34 5-methylaminomethyl-2-thiouridine-forming methyltransferase MnmC
MNTMPEIILTKDGSHSLLNTELNETYHSVHGALQESVHVFIKSGLDFYLEQHQPENVSILEIGFGTGLNALLTVQRALEIKTKIQYTSLEAYPIQEATWQQLNYGEALAMQDYFHKLHEAPWETASLIVPNFELLKRKVTLQQVELQPSFDLIFFDAFAPNKQPEMWQPEMLAKVVESLRPSGVFVTYCAKGQVKRDLRSLDLLVETLPGPPGKKEMVRASRR